jgi:uncharacterized protein YdhG (YjbR/CyaY superfamily)
LTVDEFVKTRVLPELQPVVVMLRELMREMAPDATEEISYGIPMYQGRKIVAFINPTKKDSTFGFSHGGEFEDKFNLLRGTGKVSKHIKIKNLQSVNKDALHYSIRQALAYDEK